MNKPKDENHRPLFVQFILQNIYTVYETILAGDREKLEKMAGNMNITLNKAIIDKKDSNAILKNFMSQWIPLYKEAYRSSILNLPSPLESQKRQKAFHLTKKLQKGDLTDTT